MSNYVDKISCFNFFRAVASIGIGLSHYYLSNIYIFYNKYFSIYGVFLAMFFFTTGYLIPMSLERCNWKQFAVKRFFRLFPVLFISVIFSVLLFLLFNLAPYYGKAKVNILNISSTMFIVNDIKWFIQDLIYGKHIKDNLVFSSWSMQVEIKYYIIATICFVLCKNRRKSFMALILVALFLSLSCLYKPLRVDFTFGYCCMLIFCILIGHSLYLMQKNIISKKEFIILFIIFNMFHADFEMKTYTGYVIGNLICCYFVIKKPNIGNNKIVEFFANCSYSFYLLHYLLMSSVLNSFQLTLKNNFLRVLILVCLIPFCHLIYKYIEKPMYDYGRRLASRIK